MNTLYNNQYLIDQIEKKRKIKAAFIGHNAYGSQILSLNEFDNCDIDIFGKTYSKWKLYDEDRKAIPNDFIVLYSSTFFDENVLNSLTHDILELSNLLEKRITTGYLSVIPEEDRITSEQGYLVKILSVKNDDTYEENIILEEHMLPRTLLSLVMETHDELEQKKVMVKR